MSLEDARLQPVDPEAMPFARPEHFDHRYVLPQHRIKLLETRNPHARDERIVFYEEPHIYTVDGMPVQESVSGLAGEYESEFDPSAGIAAMKRSRRNAWPRLDYVLNAKRVAKVDDLDARNYGCMLVHRETGATVASTNPGVDADGVIVLLMMRDNAVTPIDEADEEWYIFDRALTDEEICRKWELNGEDARNRGTEAHLQMELWFNSEPVRMDEGEVQVGLDFVRRCLVPIGAKAFRTEWTIFGEEENVAGCIDLAVILPDGRLYLIDWKRSEKLSTKMKGYDKMKAPLNHLEDCSGCAYAIQLSSYQYIIEKYYGYKVAGRALASIHPTKPFVTAVPFLKNEVDYIMRRRQALASTRLALSDDPTHADLCCSRSKRFVMDAVRDASGALYDAKVAKLHEIEATADAETTERARAILEGTAPPVSYRGQPVAWRKMFPAPTDNLMFF